MKSVLGLVGLSAMVLASVSCGEDGANPRPDDGSGGDAGAPGSSGSGNSAGVAGMGAVSGSGASSGSSGAAPTSGTGGVGEAGSGGTDSSAGNGGEGGTALGTDGGAAGADSDPAAGGSGAGGADPGADGGNGSGGEGGASEPNLPLVIFVATTGSDTSDCGLVSESPCATITQGAVRAVATGRSEVRVQVGVYDEVLVLKPGVHVLGGFDVAWVSGDRSDAAHEVVIAGKLHAPAQEYLAVWAHDLDVESTLENLVILAPNAVGTRGGTLDGRSSYGVHAVAAKLTLNNVEISAGDGADGMHAPNGQNAAGLNPTPAMSGAVGMSGSTTADGCNVTVASGGDPGTNLCIQSPSSRLMNGGRGGDGGTADQVCGGNPLNWDYTAQPGDPGDDATYAFAQAGQGGPGGSGGTSCGPTALGTNGTVVNGAAGQLGNGGYLFNGFWYLHPGGAGGTGQNGSGGGGGGGGGGCDGAASDPYGAGGGGGGAGGCAAIGGGGGGGGGGGSYGIFATAGSTITVNAVSISRGDGGNGGNGGSGGRGQSGGLGQSGGAHPGTALPGKGGNGAHGGHGGGGAAGNSGSAVGVLLAVGSTVVGTPAFDGGMPGQPGAGGASAPGAPAGEQDGIAGPSGLVGMLTGTRQCGGSAC